METAIWWVVIVVLGLIPIAFWTVVGALRLLSFLGERAQGVLNWGERRF